jgi:hypothetical protein
MTTILGQYKGIKLVVNEDGHEFYYSTKTGKTAIGVKGLARLLSCNTQSISNLGVKLGVTKQHEMYTQQGIQGVNLIMEDDIARVFEYIAKSRMKKETKDRAAQVAAKFLQAGFRLMVMMEVAPEQVAKEAISRIDSPEQAEAIAADAMIQAQLMRSHIAINYEADKNELKAGKIVGENNLAVGLAYSGERHKANDQQKSVLTSTQLGQAGALNAVRKSEVDYSEDEKYEICDTIRDAHTLALKKVDDLIARIAAKQNTNKK